MSKPERHKAVAIGKLVDLEDGRLQATLTFGRNTTAKLRAVGGDDPLPALTKLIREAIERAPLAQLPERSPRIVAHVPKSLVKRFDVWCKGQSVTRSRALLGRVSLYVDDDGELLRRAYKRKAPIPPPAERVEKMLVQILAPAEQVEGFDRFCRIAGVQKDTFVMREMAFLLTPPATAQQADPGTGGSGAPARSD